MRMYPGEEFTMNYKVAFSEALYLFVQYPNYVDACLRLAALARTSNKMSACLELVSRHQLFKES